MSILVDRDTRLIIQGISGNEGRFHGQQMIAYGTRVVAGVVPGRGGETVLDVRARVAGYLLQGEGTQAVAQAVRSVAGGGV